MNPSMGQTDAPLVIEAGACHGTTVPKAIHEAVSIAIANEIVSLSATEAKNRVRTIGSG